MSSDLERASNPGRALAEAAEAGKVKMAAILNAVGIDASNPTHQAALLACDKYGLDPLLKHIVVIKGNIYITRDGLLAHAHATGQLDGIVIEEEGEEDRHFYAKASVYRKDMTRPFTYVGRYPRNGGNKDYPREMAVKVAEVAALRRAFSVTGLPTEEESWHAAGEQARSERPATVTLDDLTSAPEPEDDQVILGELVDAEPQLDIEGS